MPASDWHEQGRAADNTVVVISRSRFAANVKHVLSSLEVSFDTTASALLDLFGLTKVGVLDLTDTDVVDLTAETFTVPGHGFSNADKVVFHTNGGTAPTGLTSGSTLFIVSVSGDDFKFEATVGGGAIALSGTQANFATEAVILPLSKSWQVYDHLELDWEAGLLGTENAPLILKLAAVTSVQGILNVSGYSQ